MRAIVDVCFILVLGNKKINLQQSSMEKETYSYKLIANQRMCIFQHIIIKRRQTLFLHVRFHFNKRIWIEMFYFVFKIIIHSHDLSYQRCTDKDEHIRNINYLSFFKYINELGDG